MTRTFKERVRAALVARGWTASPWTAVAYRDYETAVGPKRAHAYVVDYSLTTGRMVLQGEYWSEGRNVLEPILRLIAVPADDAALDAEVVRFLDEADAHIRASYAVRLLASGR